jgi:hypothetical protein
MMHSINFYKKYNPEDAIWELAKKDQCEEDTYEFQNMMLAPDDQPLLFRIDPVVWKNRLALLEKNRIVDASTKMYNEVHDLFEKLERIVENKTKHQISGGNASTARDPKKYKSENRYSFKRLAGGDALRELY